MPEIAEKSPFPNLVFIEKCRSWENVLFLIGYYLSSFKYQYRSCFYYFQTAFVDVDWHVCLLLTSVL